MLFISQKNDSIEFIWEFYILILLSNSNVLCFFQEVIGEKIVKTLVHVKMEVVVNLTPVNAFVLQDGMVYTVKIHAIKTIMELIGKYPLPQNLYFSKIAIIAILFIFLQCSSMQLSSWSKMSSCLRRMYSMFWRNIRNEMRSKVRVLRKRNCSLSTNHGSMFLSSKFLWK